MPLCMSWVLSSFFWCSARRCFFILIVAALEWFIHFNIDYIKASYSDKKRLEPTQPAFWRAAGLDQLMHNLTYVAMVWAWVTFAAA